MSVFILRVFGVLAVAISLVAFGLDVTGLASGNGTAGFLVSWPLLVSTLPLFGAAADPLPDLPL